MLRKIKYMLFLQQNLPCCHACCTRPQEYSHASGSNTFTHHNKSTTLYCGKSSASFSVWMQGGLFYRVRDMIHCFSFFSLSCTPATEICRSDQTTCTSDFDSMKEMHLEGHYNITVRATSAKWEVFSDHFEIAPLKIRKINCTEERNNLLFYLYIYLLGVSL